MLQMVLITADLSHDDKVEFQLFRSSRKSAIKWMRDEKKTQVVLNKRLLASLSFKNWNSALEKR